MLLIYWFLYSCNRHGIFLFPKRPYRTLGPTQPPAQWLPVALPPWWTERPGREADHSPPYCADVKDGGSYIPTSPHVFMV
jgi:hypothetical protein